MALLDATGVAVFDVAVESYDTARKDLAAKVEAIANTVP